MVACVFVSVEVGGDVLVYGFGPLAGWADLTHAVTGVPANLATHVGRDCEQAVQHRRTLCAALGVSFEHLTTTQQVHGAAVFCVDAASAGTGRGLRDGSEPAADALMTDVPGVPLLVLSADCPLVLVFDPHRPAVGVAHASWKGTVAGVSRALVQSMAARFGSDPRAMVAAIAPSAGPCCYEVGPEVVERVEAALPDADRLFVPQAGRPCFDLWAANTAQLVAAGVPEDAISVAGVCTICDQRFFSYRRQGPETGRFGLLAAIREKRVRGSEKGFRVQEKRTPRP